MNRGSLFIISAPSGTGKSTIMKETMALVSGISFSVSHTTRKSRQGEVDGVDYTFVDRDTFCMMRDKGAFLEHAEVHGNFYGTSKETIEKFLDQGQDIILDIDVQGARQIRESAGVSASFIFIVPPSWEELQRRLTDRGTDSAETIALRLGNAQREMASVDQFDYVIVNDEVARAADTLRAIIIAKRSASRRLATGEP
ncbi:MAG: guanylate kinase, partial [Desulfobulbaceae bacterium]|nr:guanylate kinase [Desulfobulbaceae bacterium]